MEIIEQKHHALLGELERLSSPSADALKTCFEILSLAGAILFCCFCCRMRLIAFHHTSFQSVLA
jgi:hypothetical protein